jgi:OOP family OmpA-OmpF porin
MVLRATLFLVCSCGSPAPAPPPAVTPPPVVVAIVDAGQPPSEPDPTGDEIAGLATIKAHEIRFHDRVRFGLDNAVLDDKSHLLLDAAVTLLQRHPKINVEVGCHTTSIGTPAHNLELSQKRADVVCQYLVDQGIDRSRLVRCVGYGQTRPITDVPHDVVRRCELVRIP